MSWTDDDTPPPRPWSFSAYGPLYCQQYLPSLLRYPHNIEDVAHKTRDRVENQGGTNSSVETSHADV